MKRSIFILYATRAGRAETIAKAVAATAGKRSSGVAEGYGLELHATEGRVLLIANRDARSATDGEQFQGWLRETTTPFTGVRYSVYTAADMKREDFEGFAAALDRELQRRGAKPLAVRTQGGAFFERAALPSAA